MQRRGVLGKSFLCLPGVLDDEGHGVTFLFTLRRLRRYLFAYLSSKSLASCFNAFRPLSSRVCSVCTTPLVATPPLLIVPLAPYGSPGAPGVCGVVYPLACPSRPPESRVCCSLTLLSAPWCPCKCAVQFWFGVAGLFGVWGLRLRCAGIVPVSGPVKPAAPIPLAYLALFTLSQWIMFLKVTCADGRPMKLSVAPPAGRAGTWVRGL